MASRLRAWVLQPEITSTTGSSSRTDAASSPGTATEATENADSPGGEGATATITNTTVRTTRTKATSDTNPTAPKPQQRDAYLFELNEYVLDAMRDHALNKQGQGLGSGLRLFNSDRASHVRKGPASAGKGLGGRFSVVRGTCLRTLDRKDEKKKKDQDQEVSCDEPDEYLFWSPFKLGGRAIRGLGRAAAEMVRNGRTVRRGEEDDGRRRGWGG